MRSSSAIYRLSSFFENCSSIFQHFFVRYFRKFLVIKINYSECLRKDYPEAYSTCKEVTDELITVLEKNDFSALQKNEKGLKGFDWRGYLY